MAQGTCKISILAKDLGLKNKEIIEVLTENGITGKTHSSPLSEDEFAFVIGYFTNKTQISNINDYLNGKIKIKLPKSATEPAKETTQEAAPEKKDAPQQSSDNKPAAADTKKVPENAKVAKPKPAPEKIEKKDRFANPLNQGQNAPKNVKKDKEKDKAKNNAQVLRPQPGAAKTDKNEAVTVIRSDDFSGRRAGTKVVDTRANNVDLSKYDTRLERYENYDKSSQSSSQRQKFNKKQNNQVQNNDGRVRSVQSQKNSKKQEKLPPVKQQVSISVPDEITVGELASRLKVTAAEVIKKLFGLGIMATVNQTVDYDTAEYVGTELGAIVTKEIVVTIEEKLFDESEDTEENLVERAPVVVVMGHVDHGKTSILDRIRNAHVTAGEAGGITQHIGAYKTHINGKDITFLDTPGHEAFTSMRARGAMVTDIAILVVAADDGIMPQTIEAINHAKAAGVEIIVAINKMDKPTANPDMVKQTLTQYEIIPEEWGGDTICVPVSALTGMGIDDLLESVLLIAEMKNLRANPNRAAKGTIIEARLDQGRGPVATVLVQNGTLRLGDTVIAGTSVGRVRAMTDDRGRNVKIAGPSDSVEIIGLDEVPSSGDEFNAVKDERMARELAEQRKAKSKEEQFKAASKVSLDDLFAQISEGAKELNIVVKADVGGSAEAVKASLLKLTNEEVKVNVIHSAVGGITESDVMFAAASNAIIVGFNVRPDKGAIDSAERQKVDIRTYRIIYDCLNEIEAAMKGMLAPKFKEELLGHIEVRQTIHVPGAGTIAGSYVQDGKVTRNAQIRVVRDGIVIFEDKISSLRRFKDDVKEVAQGYECGIGLEKFNDIKIGDTLEAFEIVEVKQ
ncbi:MAG: translation initiation factor IF-2 [Clostridia bacterium]|nr:translation initiation factor IF-2 [Clostridia bacterium]